MEKWLQLIMNAFRKTFSSMDKPEIEAVKRDVCDFAMRRWPLLFSRFYEAYKFCGPPLPKNEVLIAINSTGFYVLDKEDREILIEAPFVKIMGVVSSLSKRMGTDAITIQLLNGDEYTFQSENAEDIRQLVVFFLDGLRKRSKHLFVPNCFRRANPDQKWISCKKGDLLRIVEKPDEFDLPIDCFYVLNVRTNEEGIAPKHQVHIIPCLNEPSHGLINEMRKQTELKSEESLETIQQIVPVYNNCTFDLVPLPIAHTLQKFAVDHFRPNDSPRELWLFSPEPLRRPLLKQTEPRIEVLEMCFSIMRFMGDIPIIEQFHPVELADQIFNAAIKMVFFEKFN
jgi:myosin-7